ncbi:hypothetical protein [Enterococcus avium]|uniref:hypothetical protein n=1 Tax=Enterococcus avium TaxID=33945 RepID=UPI001C1260C2|nr:hypothetical protein [Enterococcus avium]MBU5369602.1 hypothetical protein [Enterococcus avium]MDT2422083.1 hypothetical protein [Enterococcus avium]
MKTIQFLEDKIIQDIKEVLMWAKQHDEQDRQILANELREQAGKIEKNIVSITVIKLADLIESLEVSE